jgi:hypothetical protein
VTSAPAPRRDVPAGLGPEGLHGRLRDLLAEHRTWILERWRTLVCESYPPDAARFFRSEKDPFRNPVGGTLLRSTEVIYDGVALASEAAPVAGALEALVRLRAVQELPASGAVGFVFWLKRAVRQRLRETGAEERHWRELVDLDERIDALAAAAFDLYGQCREQVYRIRAGALRRETASLLRRFQAPAPGDGSPEPTVAGCGPEGGST